MPDFLSDAIVCQTYEHVRTKIRTYLVKAYAGKGYPGVSLTVTMIFVDSGSGQFRSDVSGNSQEFFLMRVETVDGIVVSSHPQVAVRVLAQGKDAVVRKIRVVSRLDGIVHETVSVKAVQSVPCGNPDIPFAVLEDLADIVM